MATLAAISEGVWVIWPLGYRLDEAMRYRAAQATAQVTEGIATIAAIEDKTA